MATMHHPFGDLDIQSWVDGQLTAQEAKAIEVHMEACVQCRDVAAMLHPVSTALTQWQVEPAPELPLPQSTTVVGGARPMLGGRVWSAAAAAVVIAGFGLVAWAVSNRVEPDGEKPETADLQYAGRADGTVREPEASELVFLGVPPGQGLQGQRGQGQGQGRRATSQSSTGGGAGLTLQLPTPAVESSVQADIVRTAVVSLVCTDFTAARVSLERIVADARGFIGQMDVAGNRGGSQWLKGTLRVPSSQLVTVLGQLKQLGSLVSESQRAEDVSRETTDLEARLSNARETEKRLVAVLQQRTGRVADVLEVEREIARVRGEIERMTSVRVGLRDRVTYATITIDIREEQKASLDLGTPSITGRLRNALVEGTTKATGIVLGLTLFLIRIAPSLLLAVLVFAWPVRMVWRRLRAMQVVPEG